MELLGRELWLVLGGFRQCRTEIHAREPIATRGPTIRSYYVTNPNGAKLTTAGAIRRRFDWPQMVMADGIPRRTSSGVSACLNAPPNVRFAPDSLAVADRAVHQSRFGLWPGSRGAAGPCTQAPGYRVGGFLPSPTGRANGRYRRYLAVGARVREGPESVESECGAAAVGRTYLLPPLSSGGASLVRPWLRGGVMRYDVVIVGGGAAGCVLAGRLAANPQLSVLLLEAGPDYPDPAHLPDEIKFGHTRFAEAPDSQHNWALRGTITEEQGAIHVAQGKVIGGGSSINGQAMQRGFPDDFDSWAALGNDQWSYEKILPYFRKSERDLDIQDNYCHGTDGPIPVRRRQTGPLPSIQQAFHAACVEAGFRITKDKKGLHPAGLGLTPSNNLDGVRVSTAMGHLNPVRHHLNLTVRGGVFVRKIQIKDGKAVGVEAESGGKVFQVEADRVVLSAGAIRSPHLLMLSGIGPEDHLRQFGIPTVHHLPGVGQNLWNHLSAQMTFKVKDGISLEAHRDAVHFCLHYT